ncbi:universal stress protein [Periweissella fabaria]|uniref:Universal stress protein n=1 Tax=Periweissella fabaria TaxID=546157 RepID=A0ABN8BM47_9LACO|nr:universal stress protein [Periweissella fabaria]MCM0597796.1 universal stress protein [Periweissella fabaria]CAH0417245.1 Putative universal stress protein [Periweissella fabaria]
MQEYKNILAPVDGSKITEKVLATAIQVAKRNNTRLDILNVLEINQFADGYGGAVSGDVVYRMVDEVEKRLKVYQQQALDAGVKEVEIHVRFGNPKEVLAKDFPADHDTGLIVMGTTGMNAVERLVVGSVTNFVTRTAPCDVIIVK